MTVFNKIKINAWQNELRIAFSAKDKENLFQFQMGSINDISANGSMEQFKNEYRRKRGGQVIDFSLRVRIRCFQRVMSYNASNSR